jgi:hypothetical protein
MRARDVRDVVLEVDVIDGEESPVSQFGRDGIA